ncbi:MAG: sigma-70 family RNA polymerase sigma factor [marine benthic group bacterium]|nr:sigma-70 family RNA polymerase sigma factor [Gemmatimonadota bacterium]MCL7966762.1 sigma-70 family RNA polymerase sigma factor [Gemmatimonadota bacterium]MCL7978638.1 sigma-70 family RNA polymerase sigma factor [Gemmatimonadota bacterium]MCL7985537.1 sigma-70 family RNA polymerase sigma factor [Gemmatimonadota bacterium]
MPIPAEAPTDEALLGRARQGDERAFAAIVERYEGRVAATAIGMLGPGADAEEVGLEAFVRLYRSLDRFRGDASLGTYLTRITVNLALTEVQRRKRWLDRFRSVEDTPAYRSSEADDSEDVVERIGREQELERIHRALNGLPPEQRSVVVLRWLDDLSTRETAEILGVAEGTVMSRLKRAMDRLRRVLDDDD